MEPIDVIREAWSFTGLDPVAIIETNPFGNVLVESSGRALLAHLSRGALVLVSAIWCRIRPPDPSRGTSSSSADALALAVPGGIRLVWNPAN